MALRNASSMTPSHTNQRMCMCSPTNHPGSFRCSKHKKSPRVVVVVPTSSTSSKPDNHNLDRSPIAISAKAKYSLKAIVLQIIKDHSKNDLYMSETFQTKPTPTCMCSPTNHPGSFRCSKHKKSPSVVVTPPLSSSTSSKSDYPNLDRSWMTISLKENISLKAFRLRIIKHQSKHYLHRRKIFQPKPTRFSVMNRIAVS
ncbi:uncharacterized protein LOC131603725 [Vicia villosa]|uniref:uncharacterized protein LOC131603725 n=1 Tax=Vicia villosa TaxID=3911 RepID=UPI00273A860E|nr:uncharacterized protein LOC131603725 [Vicia villosa]